MIKSYLYYRCKWVIIYSYKLETIIFNYNKYRIIFYNFYKNQIKVKLNNKSKHYFI